MLFRSLDDAAARSADLPSAAAPISVFVLLAQLECVASLQNLPDFLSAPTSLLEDSRHEAALALIGSLDANDPSSVAAPLNSLFSGLRASESGWQATVTAQPSSYLVMPPQLNHGRNESTASATIRVRFATRTRSPTGVTAPAGKVENRPYI